MNFFKFLLTCTLVFSLTLLFAQPGPPPPDPGEPVPISGIEILIGAGALLGARKLYNLRKQKP